MSFPNRTALGAGFLTTVFDEFFEVLKIVFDTSGNEADRITDVFDKSLRIIRNL